MSHVPSAPPEVLTQRLLAAADALRSALSEHSSKFGLNESRVGVLQTLRSFGTDGCSQTELAQALSLSESSVCGLVDRMQSDGLIYRFRSRKDRRRSLLMLSDKGSDLIIRIDVGRREQIEKFLSQYTEAEQTLLSQLLKRLCVEDAAEDHAPVFRKEAG